jgi:hypothetical protein
MKKLSFLLILMLSPMLASAQTVSDVQNSGCLSETQGEETQIVPTIALMKEDSTLSVQLLNYKSNCGTTDFNVTHIINNESGYWFMIVLVDPVIPVEKDCECPFNVSFTIHDLKTNSFYFNCWWWDGQVELTEGESMVMAIIDDVCYNLLPSVNEAEVIKCSNYYNMSEMKIPEKVVHNGTEYRVTRIKKSAFSGCRNLTSVTIPNSVRTIGENAFQDCNNLTSVKIPNSVTSISSYAFYNCTKLTSIAIPQNVTKICDSAFRDCNSLTSITISNTVTEIGDGAFSGCSGLKSIVVEKGNTIYDSRNGCNAIIKTSDNELMVGCMKTTIPNSVTTISNFAFYKCTELTSIAIPQSVTKIGSYAFEGCTSLPSVTIPKSVTEIGVHAFYGCKNLSSITIPYGVTTIEVSTFAGCRSLTSFIIPNSVTTIKEAAFNACEGLTSISIPNSVISIGSFSFSGCESLTSITIPNSVTEIGDDAFSYCRGLTSITIPNSVTEIGNNTFRGCSGLTSVVIPNSITSINYNTFEDCSSLVSVIIPNSVTEIGGSAFQDCSGLTSVTIPNSVTEISSWTFYGCSDLISVTIGNKVDSIGYGAFAGCKKLSDVYCYTKNVPKTKNNSFENVNIEEAMLHVPAASVSAYQATEPWKNFKEIVELTNNPDPKESLYGEWWLVGWNDGGNWFEVDDNYVSHHHLSIEIPREGYVKAYSLVNEIFVGLLTLNGNEIILSGENRGLTTEVYYDIMENLFFEHHICDIKSYQLEGKLLKLYYTDNDYFVFTSVLAQDDYDYRPFIEEGKVWKVGSAAGISDGIAKMVEYYYFDGDTIINGNTCKQMMCQRYVSPNHPDYAAMSQIPSFRYSGAWYEEGKKVYYYDTTNKQFRMMYDFSLDANETLQIDENDLYVVGPKQTGGIEGFKGVYRDVMWYRDELNYCTTWLEGVGGIDGPYRNVYYGQENHPWFLMSCTVGDEVIYLNDEYEDGATPEEARKKRFDFTHTIKIQPKSRIRKGEEQSLYGEYNDQQLGIHLDPLDDDYLVSITDESGKTVYEKAVNAGSIVGLSIDISAYSKGSYTVTVENSQESFTGEFETQATGIKEIRNNKEVIRTEIYNLQGQRLRSLQKGLNIVNGQKIYVK